jgi:hypothetical protein
MSFPDYDQTAGLLDRWLAPLRSHRQRQRPEHYGPRFEGRQLPLDVQLDAVRRREERLRALNAPPVVADLLPARWARPTLCRRHS